MPFNNPLLQLCKWFVLLEKKCRWKAENAVVWLQNVVKDSVIFCTIDGKGFILETHYWTKVRL